MGRSLVVAFLAVLGLLCAAGMGYAAYVVSRGSVAVPVTKLEQQPAQLTPAKVRTKAVVRTHSKPIGRASTTRATTTTTDDHGGRSPGGSGSGSGGHGSGGGGGHGGDDD
jgi:uncharacterized membrane protein YgcG